MFKKGVSPLIATVLLVMIVVSIGAAVMVVIQGLTDEQITSIETQQDIMKCGSDVAVTLVKTGVKYMFCKEITDSENGKISLLMENSGQRDIIGFRIGIFGDAGFNSTNYDTATLDKGELKGYTFNFGGVGTSTSQLTKVTIQPKITGKESVTCQEPNLEFETEFLDNQVNCTTVDWDSKTEVATPTD